MSVVLENYDDNIARLHQKVVFDLRRKPEEASKINSRVTAKSDQKIFDLADFSRSSQTVDAAIAKIASMREVVRQHEETIHDLRRKCLELESEREDARQSIEEFECKIREERERANRSDRLVELLERTNARHETDSEALKSRLQSLLAVINQP